MSYIWNHHQNPWNNEMESLIANNSIVMDSYAQSPSDTTQSSPEQFKPRDPFEKRSSQSDGEESVSNLEPSLDEEMQRLIEDRVESYNIGCTFAEEALRRSSTDFYPELLAELVQEVAFNEQMAHMDPNLCVHIDHNNVFLGSTGAEGSPPSDSNDALYSGSSTPFSSPMTPPSFDDDGDRMAIIMNFLEADDGLGGPVNLSDLPWPLP